jgi:hypothetical protein
VLCDYLGCTWRMLPNGKVWIGALRSREVVNPEIVLLDRDDARCFADLGIDGFLLEPGDVFKGDRITRIQYAQSDDCPLRARYWFERSA